MDVTVTVRRGLVIGPDLSNCFLGNKQVIFKVIMWAGQVKKMPFIDEFSAMHLSDEGCSEDPSSQSLSGFAFRSSQCLDVMCEHCTHVVKAFLRT